MGILKNLKRNILRLLSRKINSIDDAHTISLNSSSNAPKNIKLSNDYDQKSIVALDPNLLERCKNDLQAGRWDKLSILELNDFESSPNRADFALLKMTALIQLGDIKNAKNALKKSITWGSDRKIITRMLISGANTNIGRASLIAGREKLSLHKFNCSTKISSLDEEKLKAPPTSNNNYEKPIGVDNAELNSILEKNSKTSSRSCPSDINDVINREFCDQRKIIAEIIAQQKVSYEKFASIFQTEIINLRNQLEKYISLNSYLKDGNFIGEFHGFPISPDIGLYMVQLVEENSYNLIIEFGSGTSTNILATASQHLSKRNGSPNPKHISFEHLEKYHSLTKSMLIRNGVLNNVQLELAPLHMIEAPNNRKYKYYDCEKTLASVGQIFSNSKSKILVVVDGPPGSICRHSRYPAVPIILQNFSDASVDFLLDDYGRLDEFEIAQEWLTLLKSLGLKPDLLEKKFEKGACLISVKLGKATRIFNN